jgi:hypothetical protein
MFGVTKPKKRQFSLFFQDLIAQGVASGCAKTVRQFQPVSKWIDETFGLKEASKKAKPARGSNTRKK